MTLRIMIVENEALVAEDIKEILEGAGHRVVGVARTGDAAMRLARKERPSLAFLDVELDQGENGLELADRLAENLRIPVVFLTGRSDFHVRAMALDADPLAFVTKPYTVEDILNAARLLA